jgi:hypothetical protein
MLTYTTASRPVFKVTLKRVFAEDFGHDHLIEDEIGSLYIGAGSFEEIQALVQKYKGVESGYRESIEVTNIELYAGPCAFLPLYTLQKILDPYETIK